MRRRSVLMLVVVAAFVMASTLTTVAAERFITVEVARLDVLCGGRVNWGAGRGFDPTEFKIFRVPQEESALRFREAVEIVLAAWTNERLTWDGRVRRCFWSIGSAPP